ncbi:MAG: type II toxin-antitoxin system RelE/ParE family toxin [Gammaproteobacteria bacterium]|jgi:toxin ParE1/3/4|nr:type II toxin-antitoxin system RelE/ParE family toxin [Gammaproteobacteria bacterium]
MPSVRRTARAEDDLVDLWLYVAQDDTQAADRLLEALDRRCILLAEHPHLGRARPDIAPDLHYFPVGNYLILYRLLPDGIEVVRVVHGARRLDSLM